MARARTESPQGADPTPQPEHHEPRLADPGLRDLSKRNYFAVMVRGVKSALNDNVTNLSDARSRILDTDYSAETTAMAKAQILAQASTAMIAQANQAQQNVLSLLK